MTFHCLYLNVYARVPTLYSTHEAFFFLPPDHEQLALPTPLVL